MQLIRHSNAAPWILMLTALTSTALCTARLHGQQADRPSAPALSLARARELARQASPELTAAREAIRAAFGRERQARGYPNPTLSYQREQTSGDGQRNSQNILSVDQAIEPGGVRGARVEVATTRRRIAEARLAGVETQLDFDVARAYALAVAADRRTTLARQAATAFARAGTVSRTRLAEGDVSGYANRRIQLEAARYAGQLAAATLSRKSARLTLASLLGFSSQVLSGEALMLEDSIGFDALMIADDSLQSLAARHRAELQVGILEMEAARAESRLVARERTPVPTATGGLKNEAVIGGGDFRGFVLGVSIPVPLWDRRKGALEAAGADERRRAAEAETVRRRVAREVAEAVEGYRAVEEQLSLLRPHLGVESSAALSAALTAYSEGEISLVEWLDAVRAYQEAEASFADLAAESTIRRATLERAVGVSLFRSVR